MQNHSVTYGRYKVGHISPVPTTQNKNPCYIKGPFYLGQKIWELETLHPTFIVYRNWLPRWYYIMINPSSCNVKQNQSPLAQPLQPQCTHSTAFSSLKCFGTRQTQVVPKLWSRGCMQRRQHRRSYPGCNSNRSLFKCYPGLSQESESTNAELITNEG